MTRKIPNMPPVLALSVVPAIVTTANSKCSSGTAACKENLFNFRSWLIGFVGMISLGAMILLTPQVTYGQTPNPVVVVNTTRDPVPVRGTISVTNTPTVRLDPTGNTVSIASSRAPYQEVIDLSITGGGFNNCQNVPIPPGKRLVLEYVSASFISVSDESPIAFVSVGNPWGGLKHRVYFDLHKQESNVVWGGSDHPLLYGDGVKFIMQICVQRVPNVELKGEVLLSGHTEDL